MSSTAAKRKPKVKSTNLFLFTGLVLMLIGLAIFFRIFYPVAKEEVKYQLITRNQVSKNIVPVDDQFGIVIPKIGANSKVIANVDPFNEREYQWQLTKGVAHAKGSAFPGQAGNIFIFAHSAGDLLEANRFNAVFYLLDKLDRNDEIDLFYKGEKFKYIVTGKKLVSATEVKYLSAGKGSDKTLTLMTCWPPGTTLQRLIIEASI